MQSHEFIIDYRFEFFLCFVPFCYQLLCYHVVFCLVSTLLVRDIHLCGLWSHYVAIHISFIKYNSGFLGFIDGYTRTLPPYDDLNIICVYNLHSTDAGVNSENNIVRFVQWKWFKFICNLNTAVSTILYKYSMLHLYLPRVKGYLLILNIGN